MLPDLVKSYRKSQNLNRCIVIKVSTMVNILSKVPAARGLLSETHKCAHAYLSCTSLTPFYAYVIVVCVAYTSRIRVIYLLHVYVFDAYH